MVPLVGMLGSFPNGCAPDPCSPLPMIEMHQADVDQDRLSGDIEKQHLDSTAPFISLSLRQLFLLRTKIKLPPIRCL